MGAALVDAGAGRRARNDLSAAGENAPIGRRAAFINVLEPAAVDDGARRQTAAVD